MLVSIHHVKYTNSTADLTAYTGRKEQGMERDETRCCNCQERKVCPAFNTGVAYPCPYYKEDISYGTEE